MKPPHTAGVVMWRRGSGGIEVLLGHFGGPYWSRKDAGAWAIPKGLIEPGETAEAAARREFLEETGAAIEGALLPLGAIRQKGGKRVEAFAIEGEFDPARLVSETFAMEWPPRSGRMELFPELDRVEWFTLKDAAEKILPSQQPLLNALAEALSSPPT